MKFVTSTMLLYVWCPAALSLCLIQSGDSWTLMFLIITPVYRGQSS